MPDYAHTPLSSPLTAARPQSRTGVTNERKLATTNDVSLASQASSDPNLSADGCGSKDLNRNKPPLNSDPTFQLTTMAAYLTSLQNGPQAVANANQEGAGANRRQSPDSPCPSGPDTTPPPTKLEPYSRHEKQPSRKLPFATARVCPDVSQASLAPLRSLANEIARNALLTSCRRRRVLRKLVCFVAGVLVLYTTYRLYVTSEPAVWPVSWPLVWSR